MINFTDAISEAHRLGLKENLKSYIIGLGVNYANGADGTTKGLAADYPTRVLDCPVSESAVTGMCVGMASMGFNPIVHHGRVEFGLLAMDQILTQAAKWNYMFGGDYPCHFSARFNIGRQWGNGPQHTSSYNSLFANTPGLNVLWPSRASEAYIFTKAMHSSSSPSLHMEHRWLFKTTDVLMNGYEDGEVPVASIYGDCADLVILTYGDGLVEALKVRESVTDMSVSVICLTAFIGDRSLDPKIISSIQNAKSLFVLDTSNYEYGLLQSVIGNLAAKNAIPAELVVFSPPFLPVATAAKRVRDYYPTSPTIIRVLRETKRTAALSPEYSFDEINLPPAYDFSRHTPDSTIWASLNGH